MTDYEPGDTAEDLAFKAMAKEFCRLANVWLGQHEADHHGGEPCFDERGNLLAYIAHRIGGGNQPTINVMLDRLLDYQEYHDHGHNGHDHG